MDHSDLSNTTSPIQAGVIGGRLRLEQVLDDNRQAHEMHINEEHSVVLGSNTKNSIIDDNDGDDEPSMLDTLTSEQLARRPSFKKILEDLSAADVSLQKSSQADSSSVAALQAQQLQAALQQVASSGGLATSSLLPGLLQGGIPTSSNGDQISSQLSVMLPAQQQIQLQSALLQSMTAHSSGMVQSLASQNNIPASLISSALLNAATINASSVSTSTGMKVSQVAASGLVDDSNRKRDVRLMKNREAARECRRKKKEYVRCLESRVAVLESQNQALIGELRALKELYLPKSQDNN